MKYLITSSLLDSFDYLKNCPQKYQDKALDDFIATIKREPRPTSEACQRGKDFEDLICKNCNDMPMSDFYGVAEWYWQQRGCRDLESAVWVCEKVAEECKGGQQQVPVMKDIELNGREFHLFGYADIVFPKHIIDIKTTANFKGAESYLRRSQHYLYSWCTGIKDFEYLIAIFKGRFPVDVEKVYARLSEEECKEVLEKRIAELVDFLERAGLWEDYETKFTALHKDFK